MWHFIHEYNQRVIGAQWPSQKFLKILSFAQGSHFPFGEVQQKSQLFKKPNICFARLDFYNPYCPSYFSQQRRCRFGNVVRVIALNKTWHL